MSSSDPSAKPTRAQRRAQRRAKASADPAPSPTPDDHDLNQDQDHSDRAEARADYTIDELTAATGVPSRTIRFYQSSAVLPKPTKRGRIAYYDQRHVERLELIGKMQDRGLRMRAIKDLVAQIDGGEVEFAEWLGIEQQLSSAWVDDAARVLTRAELDERLGERRPGFIAELARGGLIEIQSENAYLVQSPGLLNVATRLDDAGVSVDIAVGASAIFQKHLAKAARELAGLYTQRAGEGLAAGEAGLERSFGELRSASLDAVRLIFAREMEQTLRKLVESGAAARLDKKGKRRQAKKARTKPAKPDA